MIRLERLDQTTTPATVVGATRLGLTRALSGKTRLLDMTIDGIEESPLPIKRLRQQTLKLRSIPFRGQPLHLPRGLRASNGEYPSLHEVPERSEWERLDPRHYARKLFLLHIISK